jgi:septal ring factor EnvC (AmiA/AmiB activator)
MGQRTRRIAPLAAGLVVTFVVASVAWRAWFGTRDATDRAESSLRHTSDELSSTQDELATADADVDDQVATLADGLDALAARRDESDAVQQQLDAAEAVLRDLEAELAAAKLDLAGQQARLEAFDRCLVGVAEALNQIAVHDLDGLAATVRRIESTCAEAGVAL